VLSDHPLAIFGPVVSEIAAPASTFTSAHGVIQVSASSADAALLLKDSNTSLKYMIATEGGANEAPGTDSFAAFIHSIGAKTVAYLYPNDAVGTANTPTNLATFKTLGVNVVYNASFPDTTTDFSPYIAKIAPLHPDLLYFGYADTWMVPILTLAREQNAAKNYFGNVTILPALQSGTTVATNYTMSAPLVTQYGPSPAMQSFIQTLNAFTGTTVNIDTQFSYVFTEYPYVYLLVKAMQQAGTVSNTAAIMKYMRNVTMTTPGGAIPPIQINQYGIAVVPDSNCSISPSAASTPPAKIALSDIQCKVYS
jgi:branched-chain amino acid transport system substrate-binding protein